jgi:hypothetical protein
MIPILTRLNQMFKAKAQQPPVLQEFLFGAIIKLIEQPDEDIVWDISPESKSAKDFIDECYAYITDSRIVTEHKVMFKDTKSSNETLQRSDEFYLKGIIDHRDFIFTNN